jgi:hypothetical protein
MNKTRLLFSVIVLSILGNNLFGQKIFREGYIVKKNGEIFTGVVEYAINQDIPSVCTFKRFDIAREIEYSPDEIQAFGYKNGNRYESRELGNKNSFYEVIVTGKIVLYRKGSKFYLDKDHLGLAEIKNGPVTYPGNGSGTEYKNLPDFLNLITEGKAGTISKKFNLKNDIIPLITRYNKESGNSYHVFNRTMSEKQLSQEAQQTGVNNNKFGIISGVSVYNLDVTQYTHIYLPTPETEVSPVFGLMYETLFSRKSDRFTLRMDLLFNKQTFYSYKEFSTALAGISRNDGFMNLTWIKMPVLAQYSLTGRRIIPFVNAGFAYQYTVKTDYRHIEEIENRYHEVYTTEEHNLNLNNGEISGVGGIGIKTRIFNNLSLHLQLRMEVGSGLFKTTNEVETLLKQKSVQSAFLLGITF